MELCFNNKRSKENILSLAAEYHNIKIPFDENLLISGDNFVGLSALLNSGLAKKIDLVYIDPPFNTEQVFSVSDTRVSTISRPKNGKVAYEDTMIKDEFLRFMYERLVLIHELLSDKGSLYVHIDIKMGHYLKVMLDEIFGEKNFKNDITRIKSNPKNFQRKAYGNQKDMLLFYAKDYRQNIWNNITFPLTDVEIEKRYPKQDEKGRYTTIPLHAPGETLSGNTGKEWRGMLPPEGRHWRTDPAEFDRLDEQGKIEWSSTGNPRIKKYVKDHKGKKVQDIWEYKDPQYPIYPTQKNLQMLEMIVKQSSNNNSLVMDCFAGSGAALFAAEKNNRKWIGIDNSEIAIKTIKSKLSNARFNFINL